MLAKAKAIQDQLIALRREFHMHPELGFRETRTAAKVAELMESFGYRVRRGAGRTGVVADLGSGAPRIALRADMDALPIQEASDASYCSQVPGVMHACGHDAHTAMALGAALLLSHEQFPGSVRFLFQPSEEAGDEEGISGAPRMIADEALEGVDMALALHVDPATAVGNICIEAGPVSGGVDSWFGAVIGKGCHGAFPHRGVDPFVLSAQVILALNNIVSRRLHPFDPAVVSIGSLHGGQAENVIPERVELSGTLRYTEKRVQEQIHAEMRRAFEVARALGGDYELRFEIGVPPMHNHPDGVALIRAAAEGLLGVEHILPFAKELGAEDFGCFLDVVAGAMFTLGTRIEGDERLGHNPRFDIDERALPIGAAILAESTLRFLRREPSVGSR